MRSTRLVVPVITLALFAATARAQSNSVGWTYTMNMTTDSGDAAHRSSIAIRYQVMGHTVRMEFVQVSNLPVATGAEGIYQLMNSADSTMTMVTPKDRAAMVMNVGGMLGGRDIKPKIVQHPTKSQTEDLGAGEKILGHATRHVRTTSEGTVEVTMMGQTCTGKLNNVSEMWIAPDVDLKVAMDATSKTMNGTLGIADDDAPGAAPSPLPAGTPLRTVTRTTGPNAQGRTVTVTTTMEYVELAHGPLDPSLFAVPSDYRVTDMRRMMANLPAGMIDSAMSAGAKRGASSAANAMCQSVGSP